MAAFKEWPDALGCCGAMIPMQDQCLQLRVAEPMLLHMAFAGAMRNVALCTWRRRILAHHAEPAVSGRSWPCSIKDGSSLRYAPRSRWWAAWWRMRHPCPW